MLPSSYRHLLKTMLRFLLVILGKGSELYGYTDNILLLNQCDIMKRNHFIKGIGLTTMALFCPPNRILGQDDKPAAYQKEVVQAFVGASHSNLDKVKELLADFPNLIYSSHDWGNGDFETGIGAGGHVGHKEMVNYLIDLGARPTLHALTMLGKTDLVKPVLEAYPQLLNSLGPHGFTFLHHAQKGGEDASVLLAYFESKGVTETKVKLK